MQNPHFFQSFFGNNSQMLQNESSIPEYITYNEIVLEMVNNWTFVRYITDKYKLGKLTQVDEMENLWLNFIIQQNVNIEIYKNNEEFLQAFWKIPPI